MCAAIACAVTAGNIARKLSEQGEIEAIKERAITADVVDEISTSVYISQKQRQQEAEQILATNERTDEQEAELDSIRESLERILNQTSGDSGSPRSSEFIHQAARTNRTDSAMSREGYHWQESNP
ncbi:hypothetical protein [Microcoleus sp. D2_18a_D3]|uniref:hypothetical protein n=1 Tax=Microcoleus sp. D2_18a_D3 TaxID=3055330 RepID=UPI002FD0E7E6